MPTAEARADAAPGTQARAAAGGAATEAATSDATAAAAVAANARAAAAALAARAAGTKTGSPQANGPRATGPLAAASPQGVVPGWDREVPLADRTQEARGGPSAPAADPTPEVLAAETAQRRKAADAAQRSDTADAKRAAAQSSSASKKPRRGLKAALGELFAKPSAAPAPEKARSAQPDSMADWLGSTPSATQARPVPPAPVEPMQPVLPTAAEPVWPVSPAAANPVPHVSPATPAQPTANAARLAQGKPTPPAAPPRRRKSKAAAAMAAAEPAGQAEATTHAPALGTRSDQVPTPTSPAAAGIGTPGSVAPATASLGKTADPPFGNTASTSANAAADVAASSEPFVDHLKRLSDLADDLATRADARHNAENQDRAATLDDVPVLPPLPDLPPVPVDPPAPAARRNQASLEAAGAEPPSAADGARAASPKQDLDVPTELKPTTGAGWRHRSLSESPILKPAAQEPAAAELPSDDSPSGWWTPKAEASPTPDATTDLHSADAIRPILPVQPAVGSPEDAARTREDSAGAPRDAAGAFEEAPTGDRPTFKQPIARVLPKPAAVSSAPPPTHPQSEPQADADASDPQEDRPGTLKGAFRRLVTKR
jgi:hypothetical protein